MQRGRIELHPSLLPQDAANLGYIPRLPSKSVTFAGGLGQLDVGHAVGRIELHPSLLPQDVATLACVPLFSRGVNLAELS